MPKSNTNFSFFSLITRQNFLLAPGPYMQKAFHIAALKKIKVNSLREVHLFLALPRKIYLLPTIAESLGATLHYGAEGGS